MKITDLPDCLDLGGGHTIRWFTRNGEDVIGAVEEHPSLTESRYHKKGEPCAGSIYFNVPECRMGDVPRWAVESWEPLTISPSVLCKLCGNHGFIREGKWVPA
jgi:hypothetical protein